jgi:hypothetical protein
MAEGLSPVPNLSHDYIELVMVKATLAVAATSWPCMHPSSWPGERNVLWAACPGALESCAAHLGALDTNLRGLNQRERATCGTRL